MKKLSRIITGLTLSAGVVVASGSIGVVASAQDRLPAPPDTAAIDDFGACVSAARQGDILFLVDESSSLNGTDPQAARVKAAEYLVTNLARFSDTSGADLQIAVAGFDDEFRIEHPWARATDPGIMSSISGLATKASGEATDYWTALDSARDDLAKRASSGRECQAIAFFTDGKIDFTPKEGLTKPFFGDREITTDADVADAAKAAAASICRPTGLIDQIRSNGVKLFAVGLASDDQGRNDLEFLESVATGAGAEECGKTTSPPPGTYFPVNGIDEMLFAFDAMSSPGQPPIDARGFVCAEATPCDTEHSFVLDNSIDGVSVLASADAEAVELVLTAPDGKAVRMTPEQTTGSEDLGGVTADFTRESPRTVSFNLSKSTAENWVGEWSVAFVSTNPESDGKETRSSIHIDPNLSVRLAEGQSDKIRSQTQTPVGLALVKGDDSVIDPPTMAGQTIFDVDLVAADGITKNIVRDRPVGDLAAPLTVDTADITPGEATLRTTLKVTTADASRPDGSRVEGTRLQPIATDIPFTIDTPAGYPTLGTTLDFGTLTGAGVLTGSVPVTGPGCVWIADKAEFSGMPDGMEMPSAVSPGHSDEGSCLSVGDGQTADLPVEISIAEQARGAVTGSIPVRIASDQADAPEQVVSIAFTGNLEHKLDSMNFALVLIAALILGPGIPLALLYLVKWLTSRIPPGSLTALRTPVTFSGSSIFRDGQLFEFGRDELVQTVPGSSRGGKSLSVEGVTLQAKTGLSPFGAGHVVVDSPERAGASNRSPASVGKPPRARLPLAVHGNWVLLYSPSRHGDNAAEILVLGSGMRDDNARARMLEDIRGNAHSVFAQLKEAAGTLESDSSSGQVPQTVDQPAGRGFETGSAGFGQGSAGGGFGQGGQGFGPGSTGGGSGQGSGGFGQGSSGFGSGGTSGFGPSTNS